MFFARAVILSTLAISGIAIAEPRPVIVVSQESNLSDDKKRVLTETFSLALRTGILKTLGRQFYGTGEAFKGKAHDGALALFVAALKTSEGEFKSGFKGVRSSFDPDDTWELQVEGMWSEQRLPEGMADEMVGAFGLLWNLSRSKVAELTEADPLTLSLVDRATGLKVLDAGASSVDMDSLYNEGQKVARHFISKAPKAWIPLYLRMVLSMKNGALNTSYYLVVKPAEIIKTDFERDGNVIIHALNYRPARARDPQVVGVNLNWKIASESRDPSTLRVQFGRMGTSDVRTILYCQTRGIEAHSCEKYIDLIPTIHTTYDAGRLMNAGAWVAGLSNPKVMISTLVINLADMSVMPVQSTLPVIGEDLKGDVRIIDKNMQAHPFNYLEQGRRAGIGNQVEEAFTARIQDTTKGPMAPILALFR